MTATEIPIENLLEQCRRGDHQAQMAVYRRYHKAMYNTALRIVKHSAEAEDIMQESFLKAFTKLDSFEGTSTFGAWLKRIVVNNSISAYNKKRRQDEVLYDERIGEETADYQGFTQEDSEKNPAVQRILDTLSKLKENYRMILTLNLIEGYDYDEICHILGISQANCRTTISRAKQSLRTKLMSYED